jgi:hypothetical protein
MVWCQQVKGEKMPSTSTSYRVREGYHCDGKGNVYRKGQIFSSDSPLHKAFPNKFDIVADNGKAKRKGRKGEKSRYSKIKSLENVGSDVSQRFPDAINQGLRVFQTEDGDYNVTVEQDLSTPLNKRPMTRAATKKFLMNY